MIHKYQPYMTVLGFLGLLVVFIVGATYVFGFDIMPQPAGVYFTHEVSVDDVREKFYTQKKPITILIVPGHEPDAGGAEYKDFKERDWNVDLAIELEKLFAQDDRFDVTLARDTEDWHEPLEEFLDEKEKSTKKIVAKQKQRTEELIEAGELSFPNVVRHGDAPERVALLLHGINQWANKERFDIVLNIHFNDNGSRDLKKNWPSGLAIYVPDEQYANGKASFVLGEYVLEKLKPFYAVSNLGQEETGVVPNEKLIALGVHNTLRPMSLLIEYGYIYEPKFKDDAVRNVLMTDLAHQTYWGVEEFFVDTLPEQRIVRTTLVDIPELIEPPLRRVKTQSLQVLKLQAMMRWIGAFPVGDTLSNCPIDGYYGDCTFNAVKKFQEFNGVEVDGVVGEETFNILEKLI
ncbi:MAG: N-acetylmuramoyl-L-alanine amidase [Candidatus Pacebacteria bacterium]|nr:N-acetylmuramoyl-L-alanine amidase [Candidatus Paceibacterota bacterium]